MMDDRLERSPLAMSQTSNHKKKGEAAKRRPSTGAPKAGLSGQGFNPTPSRGARDGKSKTDRMAEYREENAMIQVGSYM